MTKFVIIAMADMITQEQTHGLLFVTVMPL